MAVDEFGREIIGTSSPGGPLSRDGPSSHERDRAGSHDYAVIDRSRGDRRSRGDSFHRPGHGGGRRDNYHHHGRSYHRSNSPPRGGRRSHSPRSRSPPSSHHRSFSNQHRFPSDDRYPGDGGASIHYSSPRGSSRYSSSQDYHTNRFRSHSGGGSRSRDYHHTRANDDYPPPRRGGGDHHHGRAHRSDSFDNYPRRFYDDDDRDRDYHDHRDRDRDQQPVRREIVPRKRMVGAEPGGGHGGGPGGAVRGGGPGDGGGGPSSASNAPGSAASGAVRIPRRASRMSNEGSGGGGQGTRPGSPSANDRDRNATSAAVSIPAVETVAPLEEPTYRYPIERYVQDPMLCEFLWREDVREDVMDEFDDLKRKESEQQQQQQSQEEEKKDEDDRTNVANDTISDHGDKTGQITAESTTTKPEHDTSDKSQQVATADNKVPSSSQAAAGDDMSKEVEEDAKDDTAASHQDSAADDKKVPVEGNDNAGDGGGDATMNNGSTSGENGESEELRLFLENHPKLTKEAYDDYRKQYGSNVMKCFFNSHLDDEWFHRLYSPRHMVQQALKERERSWREAQIMAEDIERHQDQFLDHVRLGIGQKHTSPPNSSNKRKRDDADEEHISNRGDKRRDESSPKKIDSVNRVPTSHLLSSHDSSITVKVANIPPHVTDAQLAYALEEHTQLADAPPNTKIVDRVASMTIGRAPTIVDRNEEDIDYYCDSLERTAWVIFGSREAKENMLDNLTKANVEANRGSVSLSNHGGGPGRRSGSGGGRYSKMDKDRRMGIDDSSGGSGGSKGMVLELDITCSDPFGRAEVDADGKGSAPPPITNENGETQEVSTQIPVRKAAVNLYAEDEDVHNPQVTVLSAALSSKERIGRDKESALRLAHMYDAIAQIPRECRLEAMISSLFGEEGKQNKDCEEDVLDLSIAYLRRVHLFCFYGGAQRATHEGDILACGSTSTNESRNHDNDNSQKASSHVAPYTSDFGMIYLRLQNADKVLDKNNDESVPSNNKAKNYDDNNDVERQKKDSIAGADGAPSASTGTSGKDLDESIARALADASAKLSASLAAQERENDDDDHPDEEHNLQNGIIVSETIDALARDAEKDEEAVKEAWLADHAMLDADGRARCSFHFCRKLFKDKHFLHKHLLKKHPEYLVGEQAKCHDRYMMEAWESAYIRPLPRVWVACGRSHGCQPSILKGQQPMAEDPEPELHRRAMERQKSIEEDRRRHHENIKREREARERERQAVIQAKTGFVDVDDMKEEKVEMNFDAAAIIEFPVAAAPAKKKKKKKKLA